MFDHRFHDDLLWHERRDRLTDAGRLSHLVFVDGRLVDAWSERVEESTYADVARRHDDDRRPHVVPGPPPLPRHAQALHWLDCVAGGREELLAMTASPVALPRLRDHLDPVVDEPWLVADELLADLRESMLPSDLAAPLRECLLLVRDRLPELAERMTPDRLAAGAAWVVGKANAAIGPEGPVMQRRIADHLGTTSLHASGQQVLGHVRRLGWVSARPWQCNAPTLLAVGRVELLSATVRRDLVELRDRSLAEEALSDHPAAAPALCAAAHLEEPLADELAHHREVGRHQLVGTGVGELGQRPEELPDGQVAVARSEEGRLDGVGGACPAEAALLAQHDRLRVLGARAADGLLLDVLAGAERAAQEVVVGQAAQVVDGGAPVVDRRTDRLLDVVRPLDQLVVAGGLSGAEADVDPAEPDPLDAGLLQPRQPRVVALGVVRAAVVAAVLEPQLDVRRRVQGLALHDQRVAVLAEPRAEPFVPGPTLDDRPVGENLQPATGGEVVGTGPHDVLDHAVAGQAGVAVDQPVAGGRGDHEGRVGGDQVEPLPRDRLEERAVADLDLRTVELGVEPGHPQRAAVDVGRDDMAGVGREMECLDAAPGAEVERASDRLAHRQLGEAGRRARDAEDVVRAHSDGGAVESGGQVGDHPQVAVLSGVRTAVHPCADLAEALLQQPGVAELVDQPRQRPVCLVAVDRGLEQEEPHQRVERPARRRTPQRGEGLVASERPVGVLAYRLGDPVVGEVSGEQRVPQGGGEVHGASLADATSPDPWCEDGGVLEPPPDVTDADVLEVVRTHWEPRADAVEHLAVGWGAHHWRVDVDGEPTLFATLDPDLPRHTAESLEAAYASAAALGLDFVWPSLPATGGGLTVPLGRRTMSITGWLDGRRPEESVAELPDLLAVLHAAPAPATARTWTTEISPDLPHLLRDLLQQPWTAPLGPAARELVVEHLAQVGGWAREHGRLADLADPSTYVVTHGEPHRRNQWLACGRTWLIDWESLLLAPRERDLATLVHEGRDVDHDPSMVRLFDLEWRLSEIWSFAQWLQGPHTGHTDDRIALGGLTTELTRPHFGEH